MPKEITTAQRKKIEALIYQVFDTLDSSKINSEHYKKIFSKMDNKQFYRFISLDLPYKFHVKPFVTEPQMSDVEKSCNILGVPLMEKINLPYLYKNKDGLPVQSQECLVGYLPFMLKCA